ncbi:Di-copper centre-containing protein [Annulohypoxylon maeteangense]|uniref:Di-copper centre-containing protein n=1 Tax=Annulohypoxylon maeteangense TaxID=1927788 RepID=UPI002008110B|nr:Di-copper centre-containing protein [Annulohypoxylon maeteangense]KAI0880505.1 Di-copper centre-containing protein [Annulohypoxylon maeteangense]
MHIICLIYTVFFIASAVSLITHNETRKSLIELENLLKAAGSKQADILGSRLGGPKKIGQRCTSENLRVRHPWGSLSMEERKAYTDAVLCLQQLPAKTPASVVPGARSRYDDFVATHINQTLNIHYSGTFLAWHRWFTYTYEQALRNECGYTGYQPYWNWGIYAEDPASSPIFDGSPYSMSGDGAPIPNKGPLVLTLGDLPPVYLKPGNGGGCVTSGPFKDMIVNLGPVSLPINNGSSITGSGLKYNPRCLKRDISAGVNSAYANATSIVNLIQKNSNIADFQLVMQGVPGSGSIGVHGGGHYTIGGDPGADVFVSPGDPAFFLHHGMIDLVWWTWQSLDYENRRDAISGTGTFLNNPPSPNTILDDIVDLSYAGGYPITMRELMSINDGPFCYTYI